MSRKRTPILIAGLVTAALGISGGYWLLERGRESTDDAQVEGRVMNVSARVPGMVQHVHVTDNQVVSPGDVLVELDPADYAAKVEGARADLAAAKAAREGAQSALALTEKTAPANLTEAQGRLASANSSMSSAEAAIRQANADLAAAESRKSLAERNRDRARALFDEKVIPVAELDTRQTELEGAIATLQEIQARRSSADAQLAGSNGGIIAAKGHLEAAGTSKEQVDAARAALALADARISQAESALKLAELNLSYTTVRASQRGVISRRTVEEGQLVSPDRPLFAIVPIDDVWVVANFKEDQLAEMTEGQPATVHLDSYGSRTFHGHVESLAGGTGARFALLPPDNATGNFVKVVQRLPVLIRIDGTEGVSLRPGMSADVTVRTARR